MGCTRHCATLSGSRAGHCQAPRDKNSTSAANPSTSYLWSECANFRTLSHLSPLMCCPCRVTLLVCARQAPNRRPPPQLMASVFAFRFVFSFGSSGPICLIMVGMDQPQGVQKFGLFWKMTSGVQFGSTVDTRSGVSLRSLRQSIVRRLPHEFR